MEEIQRMRATKGKETNQKWLECDDLLWYEIKYT